MTLTPTSIRSLLRIENNHLDAPQIDAWRRELEARTYSSTQAIRPSPALSVFLGHLQGRTSVVRCRTLDVGCGVGRNAIPLAAMGATVVGTDIVPEALAHCRQAAEEWGVADRIRLIEHDMMKPFPFEPSSFDYVIDVTTSCNILKVETFGRYMHTLASLCMFGGVVFLGTFDKADEYYQWQRERCGNVEILTDHHNGVMSRFYTQAEILAAAEATRRLRLVENTVRTALNKIDGRDFKRVYRCFLWDRIDGHDAKDDGLGAD